MNHPKKLQKRKLCQDSHKGISESHCPATQGSCSKSSVWTTHYKIFMCPVSQLQEFLDWAIRLWPTSQCSSKIKIEMVCKALHATPMEACKSMSVLQKWTQFNCWGNFHWSKSFCSCFRQHRPLQFKAITFELNHKYINAQISSQIYS